MAALRGVAVVGRGEGCTPQAAALAEALGAAIATRGWALLTGGRAAGVMDAAARGARGAGGLAVGLLPGRGPGDGAASEHLGLALWTGLGDARNAVLASACEAMVACEGGEGTASEVALALKLGRPVVLLGFDDRGLFRRGPRGGLVEVAASAEEAVAIVARRLGEASPR